MEKDAKEREEGDIVTPKKMELRWCLVLCSLPPILFTPQSVSGTSLSHFVPVTQPAGAGE